MIAVVGAGIGGMTASLLLAGAGHDVTLYERAPDSHAIGGGMVLQPNGLAVLYALGLRDELERVAYRDTTASIYSKERVLLSARLPDFGHGLDHALALRRSRICETLVHHVLRHPRIVTRLGAEVSAVGADGTLHVRAGTSQETVRARLIVGADGARSVVRSHGNFGARTRATGARYLRGLAQGDSYGLAAEYWTCYGLFGGFPLGDGSTYFFADAGAQPIADAVRSRDLGTLRMHWRNALQLSDGVLARIRSFDELTVTEVQRIDCERWVDGRLVLLGDAAHAMAPNLGQSASSAIVDALALAESISSGSLSNSSLERYVARRRRAVRRVQDISDRLAVISRIVGAPARHLRDAALRAMAALVDTTHWVQQEHPSRLYESTLALLTPPGTRSA